MANEAVEYIKDAWDSLVNGKKNKKKKDSAVTEIEEFINGYGQSKVPEKPVLPDTPEYTRMEYDAPDDEEIDSRAKSELDAYRNEGYGKIDKEINALREKYDSDLSAARENHEAAARKTEASYEAAKKNTDNDMLKRGIARSSIAANKRAELESGEAEAKARLAAEYKRIGDEITAEISSLSVKREQALGDFNIAYAAKLTERINELKDDRDKKAAEALKYNNSLAEKEYAAKVDKQMKESDLYGEALSQREKENKLGETDGRDYLVVYTAVAEKLRTINKNDAREIVLNNPNVRLGVGNTYYYKLYDEFCR